MGVDYSGNFGIGVKIKKVKFTKEMIEEGIDCMTEYLEEISSKTDLKLEYFSVGDSAYTGGDDDLYLCLKTPFKKGVYQQGDADKLIKYLEENNIKYIGSIDCVGGICVW